MYKITINNLKVKSFQEYEDAYSVYKTLREHLDEETVKLNDSDYHESNDRIKHTYDIITRSVYDNNIINVTKKYMSQVDAIDLLKEYQKNSVHFELLKRNHTLPHYKKVKSLESFIKREFKRYFNNVEVTRGKNAINVMLDDMYNIRIATHTLDNVKYTENEVTLFLEIALTSFKIERDKLSKLIEEVASQVKGGKL